MTTKTESVQSALRNTNPEDVEISLNDSVLTVTVARKPVVQMRVTAFGLVPVVDNAEKSKP